MSQQTQTIMKKIKIDKVVLNMGVGKSGEAIQVAKKALDQISGKTSSSREAKKTQRDWGVRKGEPIGVAVTIRDEEAKTLLKRLFEAKGNQIMKKSFDKTANLSFGIKEHIDIPGVTYDPKIGILGLDVTISLTRPGYSIRVRSKHKAKIGHKHRITTEDSMDFLTKEFGIVVV